MSKLNYGYVQRLVDSSVGKLENFEAALGYVCYPDGASKVKVLDYVPIKLMSHIDKIMYMAYVLANNKEPLIKKR